MRDRRELVVFKTLGQEYKKHHPGVRANTKVSTVAGTPLHIIQAVHHKNPMNFTQSKTLYTKQGRKLLNEKSTTLPIEWITELVNKSNYTKSTVEFINNRISHYIADNGKCYVTGRILTPSELHCHHKTPKKLGGGNDYRNLCLVHKTIHKLIHGTTCELITQWLEEMRISDDQLEKLNHLRQLAGNDLIVI